MSKPHIVVVPGAWHDPSSFSIVSQSLTSLGYTIHARQMPAVGADPANVPKDLSTDVAAIRALVEEAIGDGNDVAVIVHSWGGIIAGEGLVGLGKKEREAEGKKGGISRVGYLAAFLVPEGVSLMMAIGGKPAPWFDIKEPFVYPTDPNIFYNDLPETDQKHWFGTPHSQTYATMQTPTKNASWKGIPTAYLVCEDDMAIPVQGQDGMIEGARAQGVDVEVTRIKAGHSPFLSKPDETVRWVRSVAGEKV